MITRLALRIVSFLPFIVQIASFHSYATTKASIRRGHVRHIIELGGTGNDDEKIDDFDPLLSPHSYPNGISAGSSKSKGGSSSGADISDDEWSPFKMNSVKDDFKGAAEDEYGVEKSIFTNKWSATMRDITPNIESSQSSETSNEEEIFDPLISPHCYPKGTSSGSVQVNSSSSKTRIGILLVDHGSRREASNIHLEKLASFYEEKSPSHYVVRAAHMEIAEPSIKDGIRHFIEKEGISNIICHPYFLSPGRHVVEDIPQLIEEAMDELRIGEKYSDGENGHVKVVTTSHVGSQMDMMVNMIGAVVDEATEVELGISARESGFVEKDSSLELGGFFGEVQRMLDEQL